MKPLRLLLASAALTLAAAPLTAPANAMQCEFPLSVACAAHAAACQYIPQEAGKLRPNDLLCTVVA